MAKNASQVVLVVNNPPVSAGDISDPWAGKIPSGRAWQPTPVSLLGESHGKRSLSGDYYCKGGALKIEKDCCCREGTMTIRMTPDKICKHLDSWGKGGFSMERSKHKYKDLGLDEMWPDSTRIRGPIRAVAAVWARQEGNAWVTSPCSG